ncbi:MAG: class I SAM-dependent methyltransferase, partial [Verrucomicrobiae bacterium]|nr:class I SAM-dependent methyltransferase [Verrucomicrobiae bacterium]
MITRQQQEAHDYFRKHAEQWGLKAENYSSKVFNVIQERNKYVLDVARENAPIHSFLDVGCGTGDLVLQAASLGIPSVGVDFAEEMIEQAVRKMDDVKNSEAKFFHASIFDFKMDNEEYDLISANGFIEYISQKELAVFFDLVSRSLKHGGSFVCGSRNRLFNLFSLNAYTQNEIDSGIAGLLLKEAV